MNTFKANKNSKKCDFDILENLFSLAIIYIFFCVCVYNALIHDLEIKVFS